MFTVLVGVKNAYTVGTIKEAFELAIDYFKHEAECDVVDVMTGEILMSLRDHDLPYISNSIRMTY